MSVTSNRIIGIGFTGDVDAPNLAYNAVENVNSPAEIDVVQLTNGSTSLTVPTTAKAVTIIMPDANTHYVTLKGAGGDTGIVMDLISPTSISIYPTSTPTLVLGATTTAVSVRVIWS